MAPQLDFDENDDMQASPRRRLPTRQQLLIGFVALVLLCLVGVVIFRVFTSNGDEVARDTPTPAPTEGPTVIITPEEVPTLTPTRVIQEEPITEPTTEATTEPTTTPPPTATPTPPPQLIPVDDVTSAPASAPVTNLIENGTFEEGFNDQGVGVNWQSFKTGQAIISFSAEAPGPYVKSGSKAQRISINQASQSNQYAGIYQTVEAAPGRTYTLEMHGQIRTGFADVNLSSYGYRMQYAVDYTGGQNWKSIPAEDWVELPWDEQPLQSPGVQFLNYTTEITPTSDQLTLFIRAWNKWPDPGLAEYTLDSLSLIGPSPATARETETEEPLLDRPLPVTGIGNSGGLMGDGRFWGAVLILALLSAGAVYRRKWEQ